MNRPAWIGPVLIAAAMCTTGIAADSPNQYRRSNAHGNQLIVRAASGDIPGLVEQYGLRAVGALTNSEGHLVVLEGPEAMTAEQVAELIQMDPRVGDLEAVQVAALPGTEESGATPVVSDIAIDRLKTGSLSTPCLIHVMPAGLWTGFADQEAARLVNLHQGQAAQTSCGSTIVAVIDTGVDPTHSVLSGALVPGYDFRLEAPGIPSEWDFLDQSLQPILEQSLQPILEQSLQPILEQSLQPILEATLSGSAEAVELGGSMVVLLNSDVAPTVAAMDLPEYFGHGTMVAGVIRLVAPGAHIMPLRVFNGSGSAHLFDIIRAIYYAVDHGANVINMSFSMDQGSRELRNAIRYAREHGVVCVAAAGNDGEPAQVYPAMLPATVGVAATTLDDELSEFSNYGSALVDLAAPGSGIVTTYPGGVFAAGWGTSFSAPFVAGTAALIRDSYPTNNDDHTTATQLRLDLKHGSVRSEPLGGTIGSGRLDVLGAVLEANR